MDEEYSQKLSEEAVKFSSLEELEKIFYEMHISGGRVWPINKMFTYNLEDNNETLRLHLPVIFPSNPIELRNLIRDAIQKLQDLIKRDPNLRNLKSITMRSHLIFTNPGLVKKYGFDITPVEDQVDKASADISVDKFLQIKDF